MTRQGMDTRIRFGVFEADLESKELFQAGKRIPLANQSFVALAALLERPGQLVSREELRRRLWPDNRVVEFDQGLNAIINRLREALGSAPGGAGLIETLPRRGYRFIGTLQELTVDEPAAPAPIPQARARKRTVAYSVTLAVAVAVAVALGGLVAVLLTRGGRPEISNLKMIPVTSLVGREVAPQLSSKGDELLFGWNGARDAAGHFDLYSRGLDSERLVRITHDPALALYGAWAPGGKHIALARQTDRDSGVYLIAPGGGQERLVTSANFLNAPFMQVSWSPDGRQLAYAAEDADGWSRIHLVDVADTESPEDPRVSRTLAKPPTCADMGTPTFSADGRRLAFVCTSSVAVYSVYVTELATGATRSLASLQGNPQGLSWTLESDALIAANESGTNSGIWRITLNGHSAQLIHTEGPLGPGLTVASRGIAFVRESHVVDIWRADLTASSTPNSNLISSTRSELVPAYSPDGARIAFESTRSGSPEIWLADADGRNPVKLTSFNGPLTGAPSWCSDGRRIAFDSRASGTSAVYVIDVFEGKPRRIETSQANLALPAWSQDCRWIIASNGRTSLFRVPASGGPAEPFTDKRSYRAVVSGARVIFNVSGENGVELWSKPVEGGAEAPLAGMTLLRYSDSWTATPRGIYYTSPGTRAAVVRFYDFASHQTRVVRTLEGEPADLGGLGLSVSADEHWLLYTRAERSEGDIMMIRPRG